MSEEKAVIETSKGTLEIEFWDDIAPKTVGNFKKLASDGFYDGTAFHRIVDGFMIQGGDPLSKDTAQAHRWGTGDPGYKIKAEFHDRPHTAGVISMARSADPDSAGSQFFICLDECAFLDGQYTAFGRLTSGEETLASIGKTPVTHNDGGEKSRPLERVEVISVRIQ